MKRIFICILGVAGCGVLDAAVENPLHEVSVPFVNEGKQLGDMSLPAGSDEKVISILDSNDVVRGGGGTNSIATTVLSLLKDDQSADCKITTKSNALSQLPVFTNSTDSNSIIKAISDVETNRPSLPRGNELRVDLTPICTNNADSFGIHVSETGRYYTYYQTTYQYRLLNPQAQYQIKLKAPTGCEPNVKAWIGYHKLNVARSEDGYQVFDIPAERYSSGTLRVTAQITHASEHDSRGNLVTPANFRAVPSAILLSNDDKTKIVSGYNTGLDRPSNPSILTDGFEKTFKWDSTIIAPNNFVYLKIPLIPQGEGGMCTAASSINVLKYLDGSINLSVQELFDIILFKSGHSSESTAKALGMLGFHCNFFWPRGDRVKNVKDALNQGHPLMAATKDHMVVIVGYNEKEKKFLVWDQHYETSSPSNALGPRGQYEVAMKDLDKTFIAILEPFPFTMEEKIAEYTARSFIQSLIGSSNIEEYAFPSSITECPYRGNGEIIGEEDLKLYKTRVVAGSQKTCGSNRVKAILRSGKIILLPVNAGNKIPGDGGSVEVKENSVLKVLPSQVQDDHKPLEALILPCNTNVKIPITDVSAIISSNGGSIYTAEM